MVGMNGAASERALTLATVPIGLPALVQHIDLDDAARMWLAAVGIDNGETLTVLRRAPFRGPLHVRLASGAEFALGFQMTEAVAVTLPGNPLSREPDLGSEP
jgi:ferrous iron transport protein A